MIQICTSRYEIRMIIYRIREDQPMKYEFDTQINEGINTYVSKYAPKSKYYSKSIYLDAKMKILAAVYNYGYHFFWTYIMCLLDVDAYPSLEFHLLQCDRIKLRNRIREHAYEIIEKSKDKEHTKIRKYFEKGFKDIAKNMEYRT